MTSKTQNMGERSKKCSSFRMCLNLNDYQFKTSRYTYRATYMNPMIMTYQKPQWGTQKLERKEHNHTTKENHQTRGKKWKKNRREKNYKNNKKTNNKMAISTYLSKITLNVNWLNVPIKRHRVADWIKKKKDLSICCL